MTMIRMYVSRPFIFGNEGQREIVDAIEGDIARHFGGFTIMQYARGVWIDDAGVRHDDVVDVYDIMVDDITSTLVMDDFARRFAKAYDQESIPYSIVRSENKFISLNEREVVA